MRAALFAALVANVLDAVTTWVALTQFQAREVGVLAWWVVRQWGLLPAVFVLKGSGTLLILGIAITGTQGKPHWWRAKPNQRWVSILGLIVATVYFGFFALRNATGIWLVAHVRVP